VCTPAACTAAALLKSWGCLAGCAVPVPCMHAVCGAVAACPVRVGVGSLSSTCVCCVVSLRGVQAGGVGLCFG
jgi:hypothetical protein